MKTQGNTTLEQPERLGNQALESLARRIRAAREKLDMLTAIVAPLCRLPQEPASEAVDADAPGSAMAKQVQSLIYLVENREHRNDDVIERLEFGA